MIRILRDDEILQGTPEWLEMRSHYCTGTDAYDILRGKLPGDIITAKASAPSFHGNYYTRRGHILEDESRKIYNQVYDEKVETFGFIQNDKYPLAGYSPDGLIGLDGVWENKALNEKRHLKVYESLDPHFIAQTQFGMFVAERKWCDFTLYNPDIEDVSKVFLVKRLYPIPEIQEKFKKVFGRKR